MEHVEVTNGIGDRAQLKCVEVLQARQPLYSLFDFI
jgi:hypothetical protein